MVAGRSQFQELMVEARDILKEAGVDPNESDVHFKVNLGEFIPDWEGTPLLTTWKSMLTIKHIYVVSVQAVNGHTALNHLVDKIKGTKFR